MPPFEHIDAGDYALPEDLVERVLSPTLVVYLDRVRQNLATMLTHLGGDPGRWRPHVKTAKLPEVCAEYARQGLRQFKCATVREARELLAVLELEGVERPDLLVAYPLVGPALEALARLAERHPEARLSVLAEDPAAVAALPPGIEVFVDSDPGMRRTGVPTAELERALAVAHAAGERFRGVHSYEGHIHSADATDRRARAHACYEDALALLGRLTDAGYEVGELITSGTPTFPDALAYEPFRALGDTVHRVSPGTVVYHDLRCEEEDPTIGLVPAALVLTRVVSHPGPEHVTCDAGSKSLAAEAGDPCAAVLGRPQLVCETPSEEHLPMRHTSGPRPARGEALLLVPRHVCPTVNLAEQALLVEAGHPARVVAVAARAHDLAL